MTENDVKLIRLLDKFEAMQQHCDDLTKKVEHNLAWKHDLELIDRDILAVQKEVTSVMTSTNNELKHMKEAIEVLDGKNTWLVRLLFGAMLGAGVGLIVFLIEQMSK